MKYYHSLVATSALALTLLTAAPALADDGATQGHTLNLGGFINAIVHAEHAERGRDDRSTATSTVSIGGTVAAINGTTLIVNGSKGAVYTVNAARASIVGEGNLALTLSHLGVGDEVKVVGTLNGTLINASLVRDSSASHKQTNWNGTVASISGTALTLNNAKGGVLTVNAANATINAGASSTIAMIAVGDRVEVKGTLAGATITATKIVDKSLMQRQALVSFDGMRVGTVTAIGSGTIALDRFGTGSTTVQTNASTFYTVNGTATTSAAVKVGSSILVFGTTSTSTAGDSITASVVLIFDHSIAFLHHLFR